MPAQKKELNMRIGAQIKKARERQNLTQEELAEMVGISVQYTSDLERGKVGASVSTIIKLCSALRVSSDYLLLGSDDILRPETISRYLEGMSPEQLLIVADVLHVMRRAFALEGPLL